MLVDCQIQRALERGEIVVTPLDPRRIQPASIDLTLGQNLIIPRGRGRLTCTAERITLAPNIAGWILNNSTPARLGLTMATALWFDPGWDGVPTLELYYNGPLIESQWDDPDYEKIVLYKGDKICQMIFFRSDEPADFPYGHPALGSRYQFQTTATPARPEVTR